MIFLFLPCPKLKKNMSRGTDTNFNEEEERKEEAEKRDDEEAIDEEEDQ